MDGLEWETPDRFSNEIASIGYSKWLEQFQSNNEWKKRVNFLDDFLLEILKFTESKFLATK